MANTNIFGQQKYFYLSSLVCVLALDSVSSLLRQNSLLVSPVSRWMASLPDTARWAAASSSSSASSSSQYSISRSLLDLSRWPEQVTDPEPELSRVRFITSESVAAAAVPWTNQRSAWRQCDQSQLTWSMLVRLTSYLLLGSLKPGGVSLSTVVYWHTAAT